MQKVSGWLVTLLMPIVLIMLGVRLLLNPGFPPVEYSMPGFPDDRYGFTRADRIKYAAYGLDYLLNAAGPDYLGDLRFADGTPVFNQREVSHMLDVKIVAQAALNVFYVALILLAALGLWARRAAWLPVYITGVKRGGALTVYLILGLGVFAAVSFNTFFTQFHSVFFKGDSWLFKYSDTLIRLFPIRLWQDVFIYIFGLALALGGWLAWFWKPNIK
jgi:integral membrane protein (TIGR01906 family)